MSEQKAPDTQESQPRQMGKDDELSTPDAQVIPAEDTDKPLTEDSQVPEPSSTSSQEEAEDLERDYDIKGILRITPTPKSRPLLPLFEVVSNSIDAIEEVADRRGRIEVHLIRDQSLVKTESKQGRPELPKVVGLRVEDNGIGFTTANCRSFKTFASTLKAPRGCLGVGRFVILKAFQEVHINSVYTVDGDWFQRTFTFSPHGTLIPPASRVSASARHTTVELKGFREKEMNPIPSTAAAIANHLVEHFLDYFANEKMPDILLVDEDSNEIDLNQMFADKFQKTSERSTFVVKSHPFDLALYRLTDTSQVKDHRFHLCADGREVTHQKLTTIFPDLVRKLEDGDRPYFLSAYVTGPFLDERKNPDRMKFDFDEKGEDGTMEAFEIETLTEKEFKSGFCKALEGQLSDVLAPLQETKITRISKYVHSRSPRYAPLLRSCRAELEALPPVEDDRKLESALARVQFDHLARMNDDFNELLTGDIGCIRDEKYRLKLDAYLKQVSDVGRAQLAQYVVHRRVIVDLLRRAIKKRGDESFALEDYVHELLCPRYISSDDEGVPIEALNLWLLDERLAFHNYLASEKEHRHLQPLELTEQKRTDVFMLRTPMAFTDEEYPFHSIIIVEFKRPQRDDYTKEKNPIQQVLDYIDEFSEGDVEDAGGRRLPKRERRFFAYIVADETKSLEKPLRDDYKTLDDGLGFFRYYETRKAYVQVITFEKLLRDAEIRNKILFEKLGVQG